jgi:hypothetical protein
MGRDDRQVDVAGPSSPAAEPRAADSPSQLGTDRGRLAVVGCWGICGVLLVAAVLSAGVLPADRHLAENRRRIREMKPDEKRQLLDRHERFAQLDPEHQQRLRELHRELAESARADELRQVMQGYCRWVQGLPVYERAELLELPPAERVERVGHLLKQQEEEKAKSGREELATLKPQDRPGVRRWIDGFFERNQGRFREMVGRRSGRPLSREETRRIAFFTIARLFSAEPGRLLPHIEPELQGLYEELSPETRQRLATVPLEQQCRTVSHWLRQLTRHEFAIAQGLPDALKVNDEELGLFISLYLTEEDREYLKGVPREEMERELRMMYFREKFADAWRLRFGVRPGHKGGPSRFGPGRPDHPSRKTDPTRPPHVPWSGRGPKPRATEPPAIEPAPDAPR